jgi:hypothetical protein
MGRFHDRGMFSQYISFHFHYFHYALISNNSSVISNYFQYESQKFTEKELAKMSSCNLAESIQNKWLQASGNNGGDLYIVTVNDFV